VVGSDDDRIEIGHRGEPEVNNGGPSPDAPTTEPEHVRRPPYGRNPALAAHGVKARAEIVEAARELFAQSGYQATTVEAIGEATGRSGAAVYQYFEGKSEIFGVFLREAGDDLKRLGELFPVLTEDRAGRDELQIWIGRLTRVFAQYEGTFLNWSQVQFNDPTLAAVGQANLSRFQSSVVDHLAAAGAHPPTPSTVPLGILSVAQWSYFIMRARARQVSVDRLEHALANILHTYLFAPPGEPVRWPTGGQESDDLPSIPLGDAMGLRRPVTARGVDTVQRILLAAADRFRGTGFYGTSLSDIAAAAGVSHGSVYTYWADRDALFATLAQDALAAVQVRTAALDAALRTPAGLADWLDGWLAMLVAHGAVLYVWTHEVADSPELCEPTAQMNAAVDSVAAAFISSSTRAPLTDPEAMRVVLRALLTDVPYVLSTQLGILDRDATLAFVGGLLRAGVGAPAFGGPGER